MSLTGQLKEGRAENPTGSRLQSIVLSDCADLDATRPFQIDFKYPQFRLCADSSWTRKILGHLIRNANPYSFPGEPITIHTELDKDFVAFSVADRGPGIEESDRNQIFDRFYRGKGQRHRTPGTGLGLPIAKAIVEAHGGTISVVSQKDHGSVFTFALPLSTEENKDA